MFLYIIKEYVIVALCFKSQSYLHF